MAILVGVDGSAQSQRALEWALEEARLRSQSIVVIMAYAAPPAYYPYGLPGADSYELGERIRRSTEEALKEIVEAIRPSAEGVAIDASVVEHSQPARALTERAVDGDMIVVGSRGLGGFKGLLLGSVSQQVVQHAPCPVVVIHPVNGRSPGQTEATVSAEAGDTSDE